MIVAAPVQPTLRLIAGAEDSIVRATVMALALVDLGIDVTTSDDLVEWRDVDRVVVSHDEPFPYQLDGDYLGSVQRLEIDHVPNAVQLVFPGSA